MTHVVSTLAVVLILIGLWQRRNRRLHVRLMLSAFAVDMALVAYIELTRQAVNTAVSSPGPLLAFHIAVSVGAVVGYVAAMVYGVRLLRGDESVRKKHQIVAAAFLLMRFTNYVTSFIIST